MTDPKGLSRNLQEASSLDAITRVYFNDEQEVNDFFVHLEAYMLYNSILDKNKYRLLKCSLEGGLPFCDWKILGDFR